MVDFKEKYRIQVNLLLKLMPVVFKEKCFALKGGTAINLFVRDMPRLSVDIDLVYLPIADRKTSLKNLDQALSNIGNEIKQRFRGLTVHEKKEKASNLVYKLIVGEKEQIKIEPNTVLRGSLYPVKQRDISFEVERMFQQTILDIPVLADEELYGGKICAALDRQHPRDLFDIYMLYENEGVTEKIRQAFVVYLASGPRPMHELLAPNILDHSASYANEFQGMSRIVVEHSKLVAVLYKLSDDLKKNLTEKERNFLLSVKHGHPNYELLPILGLDKLPALQWKLLNIRNMDQKKHQAMLEKLKRVLE